MSPKALPRLGLHAGAILLAVSITLVVRGDASSLDNGWRRTAQGWELLQVKPLASVEVARPSGWMSVYFHPLLLAALQVGLVAGAYWRFPVKT